MNPGVQNDKEITDGLAARIRAQIGRIAQSPSFSKADGALKLLEYVVNETLAGRAEELREYTVGAYGLGLGWKFEPSKEENVVRQTASRLRGYLDRYYRSQGVDDLIVIELPRGGYVPSFREIETSSRRSSSQRAVELFERSRRIWQEDRSPAGVQKAINCINLCLQNDPNYAAAHSLLAETLIFKVITGSSPTVEMPLAAEAVEKSLALDEPNAEAHAIRGAILSSYDWAWDDADREFSRALKLNSGNLTVRAWHANHLVATCRLGEAIVEAEAIVGIAPGIPLAGAHAGKILYMARRFDDAIKRLEWVLEIDPHFDPAIWPLGLSYISKGRFNLAVDLLRDHARVEGASPESLPVLAFALAELGDTDEAELIAAELEERSTLEYFSAGLLGMVQVGLDRFDRAVAYFAKAADERSLFASWLATWPFLEPFRKDKRLVELVRRMGL
jgi:tetratricopeptide (TPR) repeat protein